MGAIQTLEFWAKEGFRHHGEHDWLRRGALSLGASMLLGQFTQPLRVRPLKIVLGAALVGAAYLDWTKLLSRKHAPEGTPSYRDDDCCCAQVPEDDIDEAAMESFPASDPPSRSSHA